MITIFGGTITATGSGDGAGIGGGDGGNGGTITIVDGTITAQGGNNGAGIGGGNNGAGGTIQIFGGSGTATGGSGGTGIGGGLNGDGADISIKNGSYDLGTPVSVSGWIETDGIITATGGAGAIANIDKVPTIVVEKEEIETTYTELTYITKFYNANGVFTAQSPQTITIYQGDGNSASVMLYASDTMYDVAEKINDAIAYGLGQILHVDNANNFCTISDGTQNTSESIYTVEPIYRGSAFKYDDNGNLIVDANGDPVLAPDELIGYKNYATLLVRSAVPGAGGELYFSGDEALLQALGLATIQEPRESIYTAAVYDAHSGALVNPAQQISWNILHGAVTSNIDVKFDAMANTSVSWNESMKKYDLTRSGVIYTTIVHLSDNTTILQVGANEAEDMAIHFGDMSASALGLDGLLMISRETASRSLGKVDNAIGLVSSMRAKLGAYQNRLEHTITNLTTSSTNTTAAESRIRDADMAKDMMEFTKLNILSQAGVSMMGQANQLSQNILELLK
ncbi:hypothetical protein FACS1894216_10180 [Synergistales bacterium]|nr:hypothetical protein FACS1894216_10180 [Synergistales bacterium]